VRWIPPTDAPVFGLVGSAILAGKNCPFGCRSLDANLRYSGPGSGRVMPRDLKYASTSVPVIGCASSQIPRATSALVLGSLIAVVARRRAQSARR
jgi:hypothetical protein